MKIFAQDLRLNIQDMKTGSNGVINLLTHRLIGLFRVLCLMSCTLAFFAVTEVMADIPALRVLNAENEEIASLKVWEGERTEYVSLKEMARIFSGTRKSKPLIGQETVVMRGKEIVLTLGQHQLRIDDEEYILSSPPIPISGEMAVPVEFLSEILPNITGKKMTLDREDWILQLSNEPFVRENGAEGDSSVLPEPDSDKFRVIIDPGHGGYDSGAKSKDGLLEKELTLRIAQKMKELLAQKEGVEVYLTRSRDDYLTLEKRINRANKLRGDVYLSIHFNWSPSPRSSGFRIYINNGTGFNTKVAMDEPGGFLQQSRQLTGKIADQLKSIGLTGKQDREISLALMDNLSMPGVLVEILYLSSLQDLVILSRPDFIDSVSRSLSDSILASRTSLMVKSGRRIVK